MACICGKKCSLFCLVISIWATIQMLLMGIAYTTNSLTFIHSLPLAEHYGSLEEYRSEADRLYGMLALRCYVTAFLYGCIALISYVCLGLRKRKQKSEMNEDRKMHIG
ncbi:GH20554 [Drosophila grimshawi]|uniref:GH20554 n=2 Tax=Drosophila grimshawi TaxID=7222 RepID=B4J8I6_DROGR|nr:GH20554 [Drosophila grimshawi]